MRVSSILFIGLTIIFASGSYQPFYYLEGSPEDIKPIPLYIFYSIVGAILLSAKYEGRMLKKLFHYEPLYIKTHTPLNDGSTKVTNIRNPEHPDYDKNFKLP